MRKKSTKPRSSSASGTTNTPILKTVFRKLLRLFEEDLPVSEYRGNGKCDIDVLGVREHQAELEAICGGRFLKPHTHITRALLSPDTESKLMRVEIQGKRVGQLKPSDAKFLQKQLDAANVGPCAIKVPALILGGRRKKNGDEEDFTVKLCLPPRPQPPKKPVQFDDEA